MKIMKQDHAFSFGLLRIVLVLLLSPVAARADLPPDVKAALQVLKDHRTAAEQMVKYVQRDASSRVRGGGIGTLPERHPTALERCLMHGYDDQTREYNRIITALKDGSGTITDGSDVSISLENAVGSAVSFSGQWVKLANGCQSRIYPMPSEEALRNAWEVLIKATVSLPQKDKKKLIKNLDKDYRWRTWYKVS